MTQPADHPFISLRLTLLFWWLLFVVMQQAERLFLLRDPLAVEMPSTGVLMRTLVTGLRGDFITATIALAAILAGARGLLAALAERRELKGVFLGPIYRRTFMASDVAVGTLLLTLLTVDMGYYTHDRQHLNFVFFEYVGICFRGRARRRLRIPRRRDRPVRSWTRARNGPQRSPSCWPSNSPRFGSGGWPLHVQ